MNSLHRISTLQRSDASGLPATQHPVGDVEGYMQEIPELGRQVKDMHVVILTGNSAHHYNKAEVTIRATRRS
jgi:hypothetical protein